AEIVARVDVGRLPRQETADRRRVLVPDAHGTAGERSVFTEDRRLACKRGAEGHETARAEQQPAVLTLLVVIRDRLDVRIVVALLVVEDPGREFHPAVPVERIDAEDRRASRRLRRDRLIAAD